MEIVTYTDDTVEKSQAVRLVDVFVLGPFMVWFGAKAQGSLVGPGI